MHRGSAAALTFLLSASMALGAQAPKKSAADAAADWITAKGKRESWAKATASARAWLAKVNWDDPKARPYKARIKERCENLRRAVLDKLLATKN